MERGQRRITVNYAKRQQGNKVFAAQSSHLPLKVNMAGVIPPIFASAILLLPASIGQWFGQADSMQLVQDFALALAPGQPPIHYTVCSKYCVLLLLLYRIGL